MTVATFMTLRDAMAYIERKGLEYAVVDKNIFTGRYEVVDYV